VPKYDYRCGAGHLYEKREGFDAPAVQICEVCGAEARRVLTPPSIVFKGSGWYVTDSRKSADSSSAGGAAGATTESAPAESKTDANSDSKTESKSETKSESASPAAAAD